MVVLFLWIQVTVRIAKQERLAIASRAACLMIFQQDFIIAYNQFGF
jgi:hypothetical protein